MCMCSYAQWLKATFILEILHADLLMPTFLRLPLLCLCPTILHSLLLLRLQRCPLLGLHACVRIKPILWCGGLLLAPVLVQGVGFLAREEVVGLILQRLRGTPDHRPQGSGCDLGCDRQLHRQGVHLLLVLAVVTVAGGGLCHQSNQEEGNEATVGSQSCNRRDGAGREVEGKELEVVTSKLSKKMYCLQAPCTTSSDQTSSPLQAFT